MTATIEPVQISLLNDNPSLPDPEAVLARFAVHYTEALVRHRELAQRLATQAADVDAAAEALEEVADFEALMAEALEIAAPDGAAADEPPSFEALAGEGAAQEEPIAETGELDMPALFDAQGGWEQLAVPADEVAAEVLSEGVAQDDATAWDASGDAVEAEAVEVEAVEADYAFDEFAAYEATPSPVAAEASSDDAPAFDFAAEEVTPVPQAAADEATAMFDISQLPDDDGPAAGEPAGEGEATAMFDISQLPDDGELEDEVLELGSEDDLLDAMIAEAAAAPGAEPAPEGAPRSGRKNRKKKKK